jgi:ankyrin repeat protein
MEINKLVFELIKQQKFTDIISILNDEQNIDVNIRDTSNTYLIQYAILYNNKDIIIKLLTLNCKLDFIDSDGYTILYTSIKYGYNNILKILLENENVIGIPLVDIVDKFGALPIHYAINYDNNEALDLIIKYNTQYNKLDNKGFSPLHYAIKKKNYIAIEKLLKSPTLNINLQTNIGETSLHIACNYEDIKSVKLLLEKNRPGSKINIDIIDNEYQITPLMYVVTLNNIVLTTLLLDNGASPEIQDASGNTSLHLAINENNIEISNILILKFNNFNLLDINSMTPLHVLIVNSGNDLNKIQKYNISKLLENTNLNIQDINGNTIWHLFAKSGLWYIFRNILVNKKNNLFIKNAENITPYDILKTSKYFNSLLDTIIHSYYNLLITKKSEYKLDWENNCSYKITDQMICKEKIKENIIKNNISVPMKKISYCNVDINEGNKILFTTFIGVPIDILSGLLLLYDNKEVMTTLNNDNIIENIELHNYYLKLGILKNNADFLNFEIIWLYQDIFYPAKLDILFTNFLNNNNYNFFIIPLGIELDIGAHANILIYDKKKNILERFEPNGSDPPPNFNYNALLLDNIIYNYFKNILHKNKIKFSYLTPKDYLPKIGFQTLENIDFYKTRKLGDPGGFCATWCLWYAQNRIKYYDIHPKNLVDILIKKIKYNNLSFKNIIRNFSKSITDFRDNLLSKVNMDINEYINNQYDDKHLIQLQKIINTFIY